MDTWTIRPYKGKKGAWEGEIRINGKRVLRRKSPYTTKRETEVWLRQQFDAHHHGVVSPVFKDFVDDFLAHQAGPTASSRGANSTGELRNKARIIEHYLVPYFGEMRLDEITARDVDMFVLEQRASTSRRGVPPSDKTILNRVATLRRMLVLAARWRLLDTLPELPKIRTRSKRDVWLDEDEEVALLESVPHTWRAMVLVMLRTGLRLGEARGVEWGDVDLAGQRLHVQHQLKTSGESGLPKGGKTRTVPLTWDAISALDTMPREHALVFAKPAGYRAPRRPESEMARGGEPWSHRELESIVARAARVAGIRKHITPHVLRHTFGSRCAAKGVPMPVLQKWMGHSDIRITIDTYVHFAPGQDALEIDKIAPSRGPKWRRGGDGDMEAHL